MTGTVGAQSDDGEGNSFRFDVAVQVWHPDIDPADLTEALGRTPFRCWRAGEPRQTVRGDRLAGHWPQSYWVARRRVAQRRDFLAAIEEEVAMLERRQALVAHILGSGGQISVKVDLPGGVNIGDQLGPAMLLRIGRLGVNLDIEVFPDMR